MACPSTALDQAGLSDFLTAEPALRQTGYQAIEYALELYLAQSLLSGMLTPIQPIQGEIIMSTRIRLAIAGILSGTCLAAHAVPVTYLASDNKVTSFADMVNASAAAAAFQLAAGSLDTVDFESALPANITITGGTTTKTSFCGAFCGFNTTPGGAFFREILGGSITFRFANPVNAFGFYVNGLQTGNVSQQTILYVDGSSISRTINMISATDGGGAFVGFIDQAQKISRVTFDGTSDVLGFDDLLFSQTSVVPEPGTLFLFGVALASLALTRSRQPG